MALSVSAALPFLRSVDAFAPQLALELYQHAAASVSVSVPVPDAVSYAAAFIAAFRTGAAVSVIGQPRVPSIGENSDSVSSVVGSSLTRLPSGARVRLFYPANSTELSSVGDAEVMADYLSNGRQTSDGMAAMVGFEQLGLSFLLGHLAGASSGCFKDAPMMIDLSNDNSRRGLPLLVYSHGYGGNMDMAAYLFRTMASKGMIVAAVEHTDGTASSTVLENGDVRRFNEYFMTGRQQLTRRASELLEAVEFLPGYINKQFNGSSTGAVVGKIVLGGHSYGAPSAIMAANGASDNSEIQGLILHDPALGMGYGMLPPNGAKSRTPTISYVSDEYNKAKVRYGDVTLHMRGCKHGNFVDAPLWAPGWVMRPLSVLIPASGSADPVRAHEQLAESAMAFLESGDPRCDGVAMGDLFEIV